MIFWSFWDMEHMREADWGQPFEMVSWSFPSVVVTEQKLLYSWVRGGSPFFCKFLVGGTSEEGWMVATFEMVSQFFPPGGSLRAKDTGILMGKDQTSVACWWILETGHLGFLTYSCYQYNVIVIWQCTGKSPSSHQWLRSASACGVQT